MSLGKNTVSGQELTSFVERVETIEARQKFDSQEKAAIYAEAKSRGFTPGAIRYVVKVRKEKPHNRQEREAMQDMYLHALGMDTEPPLFRFAGLAAIDTSARDQVIERMREFVPPAGDGHIDVKFGQVTIRLTRDKDGNVSDEEVAEIKAAPKPDKSAKLDAQREPVPDVDQAGAKLIGRQYAEENRPIIDNPFRFGDDRRAAFEEGWREATGSDGMGPQESKRGKGK